ncbi:hypothetical protein LNO71_03735 [Mycoplasma sp. T264T]|uniref:Uncharacterized protein n=1 Tax=Mycoplasma bradburyae TaxID=2963128 RepID=A0AAW6HS35_9MOLU|nr:hypothetical protein [Mycoplasma bradburyae]
MFNNRIKHNFNNVLFLFFYIKKVNKKANKIIDNIPFYRKNADFYITYQFRKITKDMM